jgi:hypothetical protein
MLGFALHSEKPNSAPTVQDIKALPSIREETALLAYSEPAFCFGEFETGGKLSCVGPACLKSLSESLLRIDLRLFNPQ